jgi:hypothetical protein
MKPTMEQAKKRYKSHTRGILTAEFKKYCEAAEWIEIDGYPALQSRVFDRNILLHFRTDGDGVFAAVGHPDKYDGMSTRAFGKGDR